MISSFHLGNFKSYQSADLPLGRLTVLIGANASGKSNALEALRLLSWMAQGNKFSELQDEVDKSDRVVRGNTLNLIRRNNTFQPKVFELGISLAYHEAFEFSSSFTIDAESCLRLVEESLSHSDTETVEYYAKYEGSEFMDFEFKEFSLETDAGFEFQVIPDKLVLPQLLGVHGFWGFFDEKKALVQILTKLSSRISGTLFLDPHPLTSRNYVSLSRKRKLKEDGSNLSAVLYGLWNDQENQEANRRNILSLIQSLPEQNIQSISFIKTPRDEVMFELVETFGGNETKYEAALLSDGTIRVVAIAAALLSVPEGSLVIIEEIGNGVHPSRASHLLAEIDRIAEERDLQILISTHNPALLDALPTQAIGDVVFCYRDPKEGDSRLVKLEDLPDYPELIAQGSVGELLTEGIIDRFVKEHPSPEEKKKKALDWLKSIG